MLGAENYAKTQTRDAQIIQHQPMFMVGDAVNYLCIYDDPIERIEIGNENANLLPFVKDIERRLLAKRNFPHTKLNHQRVFMRASRVIRDQVW